MDITPEPTAPDPPYPQCAKKRRQRTGPPILGGEALPVIHEIRLNKRERKLLSDIQQHGMRHVEMQLMGGDIEPTPENHRAEVQLRRSFDRVIKFMVENAIDIPE